jgi:hypothetical protein
MNKWLIYEKLKKQISKIGLTPEQYEKVIKAIAEALNI